MFALTCKRMLMLKTFQKVSFSLNYKLNQENLEASINLPEYIDIKYINPKDSVLLSELLKDMKVMADFIKPEEETLLMEELEPILQKRRYEFDHWDDAIHGFRETERLDWSEQNNKTLERVKEVAFRKNENESKNTLEHVHVLDLNKDGKIKPHVDSVRFCGHTIAGLSLLSNSVMRLTKVQDDEVAKEKHTLEKPIKNLTVDILLKRRSLYIMSHSARYHFTHEILGKEESHFKNESIPRERRVSVICRNHPETNSVQT